MISIYVLQLSLVRVGLSFEIVYFPGFVCSKDENIDISKIEVTDIEIKCIFISSKISGYITEISEISISFCDGVIFQNFDEILGNIKKHYYFGLKIKNINFFQFFKFFSFFFPIIFPTVKILSTNDRVRPTHLDDNESYSDPRVATCARNYGINVEKVLEEEVGVNVVASTSLNATTTDLSSVDKSSNDRSDGGRENVGEYEYNSSSSSHLSSFIGDE